MKKILSLVLILAMALGMMAGCVNNDSTTSTNAANGLESAKEYLYAMYKDNDGTVARKGFTLVAAVRIDGVTYPIEWTVDTDKVTITPDGSYVKVDFDTAPVEQLDFTLTATIKNDAGETATVQIKRYVEAVKPSGVTIIDKPVAGSSYKLTVAQKNLSKDLFFNGKMNGYYLDGVESPFEAVDVTVEEVTGGYRLFFMDGETKTYIDIVERDGEENKGKVNVKLVAEPTCVFTWNADYKTFITSVAGGEWYLGCYKEFATISASATSYINADNVDVSQFPVRIAEVNITATVVTEPKADTAYKFAVAQNTLGKTLYFSGKMNGYYLDSTTDATKGVNVRLEAVEGGYHIYFMNGETKTYIDIVERSGEENKGKVNVKLVAEPTCVFTWNADYKTFITSVAGGEWYLGCYKEFATISASATSYINADNVDVSQFPARMAIVEGFMDEVTIEPDEDKKDDNNKDDNNTTTTPVIADGNYSLSTNGVYANAVAEDKGFGYLPSSEKATSFTIKNVEGGITIQDAYGRYLYMSGTYNNFNFSKDLPTSGHIFTISKNDDGTYTIVNALTKKTLGYGDGEYTTWAAFAADKLSSIKSSKVTIAAYVAEGTAATTTVTVVISDYATANNWENNKKYNEFKMDDNITINAVNHHERNNNTGAYNLKSKTWRVYQSDNGTLTFTAAEGKTIKTIKITFTGNYESDYLLNGETEYASDAVITVDANTITFTVGTHESGKTNGQAQISKIEVVYA